MNHITMHGSLTVNGRTVIVHMGDGEANATVDGTHFRPIGTFVVLITVARPCGSRRVGLSFLSRGK